MNQQTSSTFDTVAAVVAHVLDLPDATDGMAPETALLDSIPEFDSMAVIEVVTALEERFVITFLDEDIDAATFETLGSLSALVERRIENGG